LDFLGIASGRAVRTDRISIAATSGGLRVSGFTRSFLKAIAATREQKNPDDSLNPVKTFSRGMH